MENLKNTLEFQVKEVIVDKLGLDILPEEIEDDDPLFDVNDEGEGLDLDSVDALELVVGIREKFGVTTKGSQSLTNFSSVSSITGLIKDLMGNEQ